MSSCPAHPQEWKCQYLLCKARRLRDAAATLQAKQAATATTLAASTQTPAYLASRVEEGAPLPEVEVEGWLGGGGKRRSRRGVDEGSLVGEQVVRFVVEGMRGELFRELVGLVDMT
jgi:hypothetical protein